MADYKTPGVYIQEVNAFPNSVVEVATAVPAFLGYTAKALQGAHDVTGVPTRISSMIEFEAFFGGPPPRSYDWDQEDTGAAVLTPALPVFYLYTGIKMFFANGGGPCWIVSLGNYAKAASAEDFSNDIWKALAKEPEPTIYVAPDAVALDIVGHRQISKRMLAECQGLQNRMAILDIHGGRGPDLDAAIDGPEGFRAHIDPGEGTAFGAAYAPWLNTNVTEGGDVSFVDLSAKGRTALVSAIKAELGVKDDTPQAALLAQVTDKDASPQDNRSTDLALRTISPLYDRVMRALLAEINVLPPGAAMAGVWCLTDANDGVWKAPANTGISGAVSPTVDITHDQQEGLNIPLSGLSVNALRSFVGRGLLIWGARTLDGNSQDWRYINVRRTCIMLEQSIYSAAKAFVFSPNTAATWQLVKSMIENFLTNQWKSGALAGSTPAQAFDVSVGLGSTMTGVDILEGVMRVTVKVALIRPAEFIVITFQQKMQES